MTLRLRWTHNGNELLLQPRYRDDGLSLPDRGRWQPLALYGADHLRLLLGFNVHGLHDLRRLLLGEGRHDLARLDDRQVLDEVARLVEWGYWQVFESGALPAAATLRPVEPPAKVVQPGTPPPAARSAAAASGPADVANRDSESNGTNTNATTMAVAAAAAAAAVLVAAAAAAQDGESTPATHWIEIELVGEDDRPIPHEAYEVTLPDQRVVSGQLDANGWARIDGLDSDGDCLVSFPKLDTHAWVVHPQSPLAPRQGT